MFKNVFCNETLNGLDHAKSVQVRLKKKYKYKIKVFYHFLAVLALLSSFSTFYQL